MDLGVFAATGLVAPIGLAFDLSGNLYVANFDDDTIRKFSPTGADLGSFASIGLDEPCGLVFDPNGNLYASNYGNGTIRKFSPTGTDLGNFAISGLNYPTGLAFGPAPAGPSPSTVPEPGALGLLLGSGLASSLFALGRLRRRA